MKRYLSLSLALLLFSPMVQPAASADVDIPARTITIEKGASKSGEWLDGTPQFRLIMRYDESGRLVELKRWPLLKTRPGLVDQEQFVYDDENPGGKMTKISSNGLRKSRNVRLLRYNTAGQLLQEDIRTDDPERAEYTRVRHYYDDQGNETQMVFLKPDGSPVKSVQYRYDADGNQTHVYTYSPNHSMEHLTVMVYNPDGKMTEKREIAPDHSVKQTFKYRYDEKGEMNRLTIYQGEDRPLVDLNFDIEYDAAGHWIKQVATTPDGEESMEVRTIEYY
jgi:hypothetical protein